MIFKIEVFKEDEWADYKALRLASLKDAPDAFSATYEQESRYTDHEWKSRIKLTTGTLKCLPLAAKLHGSYIGLAFFWGGTYE